MSVRGERIIIFGDSLSHHGSMDAPEIWDVNQGSVRSSSAPGDLLASMLIERGAAAVRVNANVGRSARNFWTAPNRRQHSTGAALMAHDATFRPTRVIVILGTNDADGGGMDAASMKRIVDGYRSLGASVTLVGPPAFADARMTAGAEKVYGTLRSLGLPVVDARPLSVEAARAGDGIHFTSMGAHAFAQKLLPAVESSGGGLGIALLLALVAAGVALGLR